MYNVGDKSKAVCDDCENIVSTTFKQRIVVGEVKGVHYSAQDVLVGVCDCCHKTVSIPQQSVPQIREARVRALGYEEVSDEQKESTCQTISSCSAQTTATIPKLDVMSFNYQPGRLYQDISPSMAEIRLAEQFRRLNSL